MNDRYLTVAAITGSSSLCYAAEGLQVAWSDVRGALFFAATRADVRPPTDAMGCISEQANSCRWSAGDGVEVVAINGGAGHLTQTEAMWNTAKSSTTGSSAKTFRTLCATIVGLARPAWGTAQIAQAVSRTMILRPSPKDSVDAEQSFPGLKIYGSRNTPSPDTRDRPDEAFLQCGAVAD